MMNCPSPSLPSKLGTSPTTTATPPYSCMSMLMRAYSESGASLSQPQQNGQQQQQLPEWPPQSQSSHPTLQPRSEIEDSPAGSSVGSSSVGGRTIRNHQRSRSLSVGSSFGSSAGAPPPPIPYYAGVTQGTPRLTRPVAKIQRRSGMRRELDPNDNFFLIEE